MLKNIHGEHAVNTEAIACCTQTAVQKAPTLLALTLFLVHSLSIRHRGVNRATTLENS